MPSLFDAINIDNLKLENRIMISPMCQYSGQNGNATDWHMAHVGGLALSGAGLLCIEATGVTPEGRITPFCLGLWNDENEHALKRVIDMVRQISPIKIAIQLGHAGRKASCASPWDGGNQLSPDNGGWQTIAPSAVAHKPTELSPKAMQNEDFEHVLNGFVQAAQRSVRLGIDAIELHAAHGYLLHEFLSPIANQRTDEFGGSLENRMRFPLMVFEAIKNAVPSGYPVGIRVSATDWVENIPSWNLNETIAFAKALEERGVSWIDVSSGGVSDDQKINIKPGYQVELAKAIKAAVNVPIITVGLITEANQAQEILDNNEADIIAIGRSFLYNPRWPWHAANQLNARVYGSPQYWRGLPMGSNKIFDITKKD